MKNEILANLDNPAQLERLYRLDKPAFKREFNALYPQLKNHLLGSFWNERLNFASEEISWASGKEILFVIISSVLAGLIAKIPAFFRIEEEVFYPRNIGFVIFPALTAFFAWKNQLSLPKLAGIAGAMLLGLGFINVLPQNTQSDTLVLSCIHLLLFLWSILGFAFVGETTTNVDKRLSYLQYNGDLVVITTLIVIAGILLTGITIGLFSLLGLDIKNFYFENVVVFALPAAPILGTYLTQANPHLVGKVSPLIARLFSPLVLVMLLVYLGAIVYSGKDPYNDRDFLLLFNALLVGVMAIIFFSVADASKTSKSRAEIWILFLLSVVTVVVNGIALSAILFRITEWGMTPNRAAVLGGNVLILVNLLLVTIQLSKIIRKKAHPAAVGRTIAVYLPVYCGWTIIVVFLFPFLFGFK